MTTTTPRRPRTTFCVWFIRTIWVTTGYVGYHCILRTLPDAWHTQLPIDCFAEDLSISINQFFDLRQPGVTVSADIAQLLDFPVGKL